MNGWRNDCLERDPIPEPAAALIPSRCMIAAWPAPAAWPWPSDSSLLAPGADLW